MNEVQWLAAVAIKVGQNILNLPGSSLYLIYNVYKGMTLES